VAVRFNRRWLACGLALALLTLARSPDVPADTAPAKAQARPREPVALALAEDGRWLFAANRRGTVSVIDVNESKATAEAEAGKSLADLAVTPDGKRLLAVDEEAGELVVLSRKGPELTVAHRLAVAATPVSVVAMPDGSRCCVASLWSRRLSVIDLGGDRPKVVHAVALPFAPRKQLALGDGGRVLVADSFGGQLAVVDPGAGKVESVRAVPGHNVRGLALTADGKGVLLAQQVLGGLARTTRDDVHWGNVLTNDVRVLGVAELLRPDADLLRGSELHGLGDVGKGAGDPSGVAVAAGGTVVVTLGGTGEVALGPERDVGRDRLAVGRRPAAVAVSPDGKRAYVANTFADSVSVVDVPGRKVAGEVSLGTIPELSPAQEGERLFYDARLSLEGWFSCHSCHTDGHTNGQLNDNLGDGSFGAPKRVLSLRGVKDTGPWAWNGTMDDLGAQVRKSIRTTMNGDRPTDEQVRALEAFLRTLPPVPPLAPTAVPADEEGVRRGKAVFERAGCADCHKPPAYTSGKTYDVGLADEVGNRHFNPPSLRGVGQGGPYFHDGRALTLEEVFTRHRHQLKEGVKEEEVKDLVRFLESL
jgi:YVTN family beta-propeller protein